MTNEGQEADSFLTPNHTLKNSANIMYLKLIMTLKRVQVIGKDTEKREDSIELSCKYDDDRLIRLLNSFSLIKAIILRISNGFGQTNFTNSDSFVPSVSKNLES